MVQSVAKMDKLVPNTATSLTFSDNIRPTSFGVPLATGSVGSLVASAGSSMTITDTACTSTSKVLLISVKLLGSTPSRLARGTPGAGQFTITPLSGSFTGGEKYDYVIFN